MNDYLSRAGKIILIIVITVSALSIAVKLSKPKVVYIEEVNIPSAHEIQRRLKSLNDPRYDPGKIDGVIGVDTKSQKAWDNYTKDQFAKRAFEGDR